MWRETRETDLAVFKCFDSGYEPVAQSKKTLAEIYENGLARHGNGSKVDQGRMFGPSDITADGAYERMENMMMRNSIEPFLSKLPSRALTIEMCVEVLKRDPRKFGKHKDEKHFYPVDKQVEIDGIVNALIEGGLTTTVLATLSCALVVFDSVTTACLRNQDTLGSDAFGMHIVTRRGKNGKEIDILRAVLPPEFKNRESQYQTTEGCAVNHTKDDKVKNAYAVMIVIGRPSMRKLLAIELEKEQANLLKTGGVNVNEKVRAAASRYQLTEKIGPFDKNGRVYDNSRLYDLFKYVGKRALGLPFFGPNILRTVHVTKVVRYCVENNIDPNHPDVVRLFALARHGEHERKRSYASEKAYMVNNDGYFGYNQRGVNPTSKASSFNHGLSLATGGGVEGLAAFLNVGEMRGPDYQSGRQVVPASTTSASADASLVRMIEEGHRREIELLKRLKDVEIAQLREEIVEMKDGGAMCKTERGVEDKEKKKALSENVQKKLKMLRDMHPRFVKIAKEVWSDAEKYPQNRIVVVNGESRNGLAYQLKLCRDKPPSLMADCVKEKLMSAEPVFCGEFYKLFKGSRPLIYA